MKEIISKYLKNKPFQIHPLTGDAGTRAYFRITTDQKPSLICCVYKDVDSSFENFVNFTDLFTKNNIKAPQIFLHKGSTMILEDLGALSLEDSFKLNKNTSGLNLYYLALDELLKIQNIKSDLNFKSSETTFTQEKFTQEMNFAIHHITKLLKLKNIQLSDFQPEFLSISKSLTSAPQVLTHRDFHSRNLMIKNNACYIIDFQDARQGPFLYDLVSLIEDPYVELEQKFKDLLIQKYCNLKSIQQDQSFKDLYQIQKIQRIFKACGSFASLKNLKDTNRYLQYLSPSLHNLNLSPLKGFPKLKIFISLSIKNINNI